MIIFRLSVLGLIVAAAAAAAAVIVNAVLFDQRYRSNLRKIYKEKLGSENEFTCEVELSPEGMIASGQDYNLLTKWSEVEDVVPTNDSVDIFGRKGGCIVRNRAFESPDERQRFIDLARDYMNKSRGAVGP
jgi:hypothetical protein